MLTVFKSSLTPAERTSFALQFQILDRSLNAFASWHDEVGLDVDFLESDALEQLKTIAADMRDGNLKTAFAEEPTAPSKDD